MNNNTATADRFNHGNTSDSVINGRNLPINILTSLYTMSNNISTEKAKFAKKYID
jgi:hypothetical protein